MFTDALMLVLWTFAHWVHCERFCSYDHSQKCIQTFKGQKCENCKVHSNRMSFFSYYGAFEWDKTTFGDQVDEWNEISKNLLSAVEKLPQEPKPLFRGVRAPLERYSLRHLSFDDWPNDRGFSRICMIFNGELGIFHSMVLTEKVSRTW